jgi:hypothetical protein
MNAGMSDVAPLEAARVALGLTISELWIGYLTLGGRHGAERLGDYLIGGGETSPADHNVIVHVLNEEYSARGENHPLAYTES